MKMQKCRSLTLATIMGLLVLMTADALRADYSIDWWTIDAGGKQNMTGGNYALAGTIGQHDAGGPLVGGNFELVGGFWAGAASEPFCFGDLNGDGLINLSDLAQLLGHYGTPSGATYEMGDLDEDGDVDLSDLAALLGVYGHPCP